LLLQVSGTPGSGSGKNCKPTPMPLDAESARKASSALLTAPHLVAPPGVVSSSIDPELSSIR
jgi:hypothetical protein